jgi:hypothetical protein
MSESLRQALVDFLNQHDEAVYPTAAIQFYLDGEGLNIEFRNSVDGRWGGYVVDPQDLAQFLLEYSIV